LGHEISVILTDFILEYIEFSENFIFEIKNYIISEESCIDPSEVFFPTITSVDVEIVGM